jgi:HK97 family phage portal protein
MGLAKLLKRDAGAGQMGWPDYQQLFANFGFNGFQYQVPAGSLSQITALQAIRNPIVLACIFLRCQTFAEVRVQFQRLNSGRAARDLFGTAALNLIEHPYPGAGTGTLFSRMELDDSMYGNSYWWPSDSKTLTWLDPTRMKIITSDILGPNGGKVGQKLEGYQIVDKAGKAMEIFLPGEIMHFKPMPDPDHPFRGLSWLSSLLGEVSTDQDISDFKRGFLRNSATPNLVFTLPANISADNLQAFRDRVDSSHTGPNAAFKTLYVNQGVDVKTVGANWSDMELFATQSYGDTRLAVASGVPASMLGIAEGLKGSALNAGNYAAVRRKYADTVVRPLWREACIALETIAPPPPGARVWYDDRDTAFLQVDLADAATVRQLDAATITSLVTSGFSRESAVEAVTTNDLAALEEDPTAISVQLQPAVPVPAIAAPATPDDNVNDNGDDNAP